MKKRSIICLLIAILIVAMVPSVASAKTYTKSKTYGNVTYSITSDSSSYYYKNKNTYITSTMKWKWKYHPPVKQNDIVAMSTSDNFHVAQEAKCKGDTCVPSNIATCKITYKVAENQSVENSKEYYPKTISYKVYTKSSGKGAFVKFPMKKTYKIHGMNVVFYANSGTMTVKWEKSGKNYSVGLSSCYGHYNVKATPKANFSGANIDFSGKCSYGTEAYMTMKR